MVLRGSCLRPRGTRRTFSISLLIKMRSHVRIENLSTSQAATYLVGLATIAGALLSPDPLMIAACGLALAAIMKLLWTVDEPPILLLPCLYQWSEVATWPI